MNKYLQLLTKHRSSIMGFAILWIMLFHLPINIGFMPLYFIKSIGYGGVDIFLFLSGFGLYFSLSKSFDLKKYYKSRFTRIMPEFWFVLLTVFIIQMDYSAESFYKLLCRASTLGYWVWGKGAPYVLWYISCILLFYGIYPSYFKLFKKHGIKIPLIIINSGLVLIILYALVCVVFFGNKNIGGLTILTYARIPIFFIGSIFGHWAKDGCDIVLSKNNKIMGLASAFVALIALACFMRFFHSYLWICSLYFIPFIVITPILCIVLSICFDKLKTVDTFFTHIGGLSLELYICHTYSYNLFNFFTNNYGIVIATILIIMLSIISACALYFINIKVLQKIFNGTRT